MLTNVQARNVKGALLNLSLQDVSQGYIVEEIEGLDPVKATLVSSGFAQLDGELFQAARREKRNIVIKLALDSTPATGSVQDLRDRLYSFFMPKSEVTLSFTLSSGLTTQISGRIESFDAPRFVKDPTAAITILCFNPDFVNVTPVVISGNTTTTTADQTVNYKGTVETGILFRMTLPRSLNEFVIVHNPEGQPTRQLEFETADPLLSGDVIEISTHPGNKYARLTRANVTTSVLYSVSTRSNWIRLEAGINRLRVNAVGAAIPYTIGYSDRYGGV